MKKRVLIALAGLLAGGAAAWADSAPVMPARYGRLYLAPTFAFANGAFGTDWDYSAYDDGEGAFQGFNLGAALEYGVTNWFSAAFQWAPGYTVYSDVDMKLPYIDASAGGAAFSSSSVNANDSADLFLGGKFLILGEGGLVDVKPIRLAMATGVKVPLGGSDYEAQYKNAIAGDAVTAQNGDKHVLGLGARVYFDYIINKNFFINLYGEFLGYPIQGDIESAGYAEYMAMQAAKLTALVASSGTRVVNPEKAKVQYGYDLTLELEPQGSCNIAEKTILSAGLPFRFTYNPGKTYNITMKKADVPYKAMFESVFDSVIGDTESAMFQVIPNVSIFFLGWALPVEFKLQWGVPLVGRNSAATNAVTAQVKAYFKI